MMPWWGWVIGYVAVGLLATVALWRADWIAVDGSDYVPTGLMFLLWLCWPLVTPIIVGALICTIKIPTYETWQERRREAEERRQRPSEVSPAAGERVRR